ncbi:glycosyltransferase involved in cell wall biosynthesis [Polymorphobacter fuscus]|nr:glycosyltransferase family 1 protein [Polymorphobacter fuscus]NJC07838.1 glycosyltransferase involved in cell wall biosynthesis [Polymorphobacter fuscus]
MLTGVKAEHCSGKVYLNVGHTDFDLPGHWRWIKSSNVKAYYMLHDLIPVKHPNLTRPHAVRRHSARVTCALKNADGIIANSQATLTELAHFASRQALAMPSVVVAHLGVDHIPQKAAPPYEAGEHFVCLNTIEPRKNHLLLLRVWQKLIAAGAGNVPRLVLIGRWGLHSEKIQQMLRSDPRLNQHVTVLANCEDAQTFRLIRSASAVLVPSMAEGYGLPLAEAMALGIPVIASDLPCFREIGDAIPLLVPATDEGAWQTAITEFMRSKKEAARQRNLLQFHRPKSWNEHFGLVDRLIAGIPSSRPDATGVATLHRSNPVLRASLPVRDIPDRQAARQ